MRLRLPLLVVIISLTALAASAQPRERNQPLNVKAASVAIDEKTGVAVYRGNVVMIQGNLRVEADRLEVRTDKNRRLDTVIATGRPARLRGFTENRDEELLADAERVVFQAAAREIELTGNARARQGGDEFRAQQIHYGMDSKQLLANGSGGTDGRVHVTIQPRAQDKKP